MPKITETAVWCDNVMVKDSYGNEVELAVYQDISTFGVFAVDASFIEQEEPEKVSSPFMENVDLKLTGD